MSMGLGKFKCVLLVDDDEVSNFITKKMIDHFGFADNVMTVSSGKQALAYIEINKMGLGLHPPCLDLILLDVNMPEMNGFQFLEEFYRDRPMKDNGLIIVMLSSSESPKDIERSKTFPIQGYICKPLTSLKLEQAIGVAMNTSMST